MLVALSAQNVVLNKDSRLFCNVRKVTARKSARLILKTLQLTLNFNQFKKKIHVAFAGYLLTLSSKSKIFFIFLFFP